MSLTGFTVHSVFSKTDTSFTTSAQVWVAVFAACVCVNSSRQKPSVSIFLSSILIYSSFLLAFFKKKIPSFFTFWLLASLPYAPDLHSPFMQPCHSDDNDDLCVMLACYWPTSEASVYTLCCCFCIVHCVKDLCVCECVCVSTSLSFLKEY